MRKPILAILLLAAGCCPAPPHTALVAPAVDRVVDYSTDDRDAYGRVLRAIVGAGLSVEMKDADAGVVQTGFYMSEADVYSERRVRFLLTVVHGHCTVKPMPEAHTKATFGLAGTSMPPGQWKPEEKMSQAEAAALSNLVSRMELEFQQPK